MGANDAFLQDASPNAYEKVVDRLLASPRYGERMAIRWLDAARYADSNGYTIDGKRSIWPWRDWVINALNGDPGIYSARWAGPDKNFSLAMERVRHELGDEDPSAYFVCALALAWQPIVSLTDRPVEALNADLRVAKIDSGSLFPAVERRGNVSNYAVEPKAIKLSSSAPLAGLEESEFPAAG